MIRRAGLLLAVAALLAGCGDPEPSSPTAADLEDVDLSPDHTIVVDDGGYDPATLDITAGEVVRVVNEGEEPHSFTAEDGRFDTRLEPGDDTTILLTEPGDISYHDVEDPSHEGTLTVRADG